MDEPSIGEPGEKGNIKDLGQLDDTCGYAPLHLPYSK